MRQVTIVSALLQSVLICFQYASWAKFCCRSNILLDGKTALLADFGLTMSIVVTGTSPSGRIHSVQPGLTYSYAAPERFSSLPLPGQQSDRVNTQADVYSYALVLYFMWTSKVCASEPLAKSPAFDCYACKSYLQCAPGCLLRLPPKRLRNAEREDGVDGDYFPSRRQNLSSNVVPACSVAQREPCSDRR